MLVVDTCAGCYDSILEEERRLRGKTRPQGGHIARPVEHWRALITFVEVEGGTVTKVNIE